MRIAIVDDDGRDAEKLRQTLAEILEPGWGQGLDIQVFFGGEDFFRSFEADRFDLVFLDIFMDEMIGVEVAGRIRRSDSRVQIVFVTTSNDFASESYQVEAAGYLLKPCGAADLKALLDRVLPTVLQRSQTLSLPDGTAIDAGRIRYSEYHGHYAYLHLTSGQVWKARVNFSRLEEEFQPLGFFCSCNRGIIVNLNEVENISDQELILKSGERLPVSRRKLGEVKKAFAAYCLLSLE